MADSVSRLAGHMVLGALLDDLTRRFGDYDVIAHWTQGEFHHDVVLRFPEVAASALPGRVLVVATNCNGGIREVLAFAEVPDRSAPWHRAASGVHDVRPHEELTHRPKGGAPRAASRTSCCALAGIALASCQPTPPPRASPVLLPPVAASTRPPPSAVPTFSAPDGVYVLVGLDAGASRSTAWVRTMPRGVSMSIGSLSGHADAIAPEGVWRMRVADQDASATVTLRPPEHAGAAWRITVDDPPVAFEQRVGALEARVRDQLLVGQRFVRLDQRLLSPDASVDGAYTRDVITVLPHGLVQMELPDGHGAACVVDALMPLVDESGVPVPSPLPAAGDLGVVPYGMPKVSGDCDELAADAGVHGDDGAAFVFADESGRAAGMLVVSYMYAEIFAAPGLSQADLARMQRAARLELEHQAE